MTMSSCLLLEFSRKQCIQAAQTEVKVEVWVFCDGNFANEPLSLSSQGGPTPPFVWPRLILLSLGV